MQRLRRRQKTQNVSPRFRSESWYRWRPLEVGHSRDRTRWSVDLLSAPMAMHFRRSNVHEDLRSAQMIHVIQAIHVIQLIHNIHYLSRLTCPGPRPTPNVSWYITNSYTFLKKLYMYIMYQYTWNREEKPDAHRIYISIGYTIYTIIGYTIYTRDTRVYQHW